MGVNIKIQNCIYLISQFYIVFVCMHTRIYLISSVLIGYIQTLSLHISIFNFFSYDPTKLFPQSDVVYFVNCIIMSAFNCFFFNHYLITINKRWIYTRLFSSYFYLLYYWITNCYLLTVRFISTRIIIGNMLKDFLLFSISIICGLMHILININILECKHHHVILRMVFHCSLLLYLVHAIYDYFFFCKTVTKHKLFRRKAKVIRAFLAAVVQARIASTSHL